MKIRFAVWNDPWLHLFLLALLIAAAVGMVAKGSRHEEWPGNPHHPASCKTCTSATAEQRQALHKFLVRAGYED
ncbi:MAG: hypothetical protein IRY99_25750 [Isosphaeraceae bacterium]|nr:hypothetical protein [Isosphaeraceae bacterium]